MLNIDFDNLNPAVDLLKANQEVIQGIALQYVIDFGFSHHEVVVMCAEYDSFWKEFVDGLNPEAAAQADFVRKQGLIPNSIYASTQSVFAQYFKQIGVNICIPQTPPRDEMVWVLFLHAVGHTWLQVEAR